MHLAVAVRTEENAFGELRRDLLPPSRDALGRDAELLRRRIDVMELERVYRLTEVAADARTAHRSDGAKFQPAAESNDLMPAVTLEHAVAGSVAICTKKEALFRLITSPHDAPVKAPEGETLIARVSVMELECPDGSIVAAILARSTASRDQFCFDRLPPTTAVVHPRGTPSGKAVSTGDDLGRRVVRSEWRTLEAEHATRKNTPGTVDHHRTRYRRTAAAADLHS